LFARTDNNERFLPFFFVVRSLFMMLISLLHQVFLASAHRLGFGPQLRSALGRSNNNCSFLSRLLSTNALDLALATLTQKVEADTVVLLGINQVIQAVAKFQEVHFVQFTLEDTILHPLPEVFQRFEDAITPLVVCNIVRHYDEHPSISYEVSQW
jgi:hypothetical protein